MMEKLLQRGEALARQGQRRQIQAVAERLRGIFGSAAVEAEEGQVLVSGRGLVKRWLIDPSLRFLSVGLQ